MKILHTIPSLNASSGGPSTCTYSLLRGLNNMGVNADILTLGTKGGEDRLVGEDYFIKMVENDAFSPIVYSRNFKKYLYQNQDYDLYHANSIWTYPSHLTRVIANKRQKPVVLSPHGMLYPPALKVSAWKKKLVLPLFQRKDLQSVDCLHATCMTELEHIRSFGLIKPIAIIPNCLHINMAVNIRSNENSIRRFGFVGRLNRYKNIDVLLKSWKNLGSKTKYSELVIIGDGDVRYKHELEMYVNKYDLKNVHFLGFLNGEELKTIVRSLDFQVLPSKSENFGMVVPEALINGVPVIASKGTPWQELNTYGCGWWVDNSVDALMQALNEALLLSETKRIKMGENGRKLVWDKYTVEKVSLQMYSLYNWLVNRRDKPEFIHLY